MEKFNYHTELYSCRALHAMNAIVTRIERRMLSKFMYDVMFDSCHEVIVSVKDDMKHEIRRLIENTCKDIIDEIGISNKTHVMYVVKEHDIKRYCLLADDEFPIHIDELHHSSDNYKLMSIPIIDFKFINDFFAGSKDLVSRYGEDYVNLIVGKPSDCIMTECNVTINAEISKLENELVETLNHMNLEMKDQKDLITKRFCEMKSIFIEEMIAKISGLKQRCMQDDDILQH